MTESKPGNLIRIRSLLPSLAKVHKRIAKIILENPGRIIHLSVTELADQARASEASVVLFCKRLGFRGYHDFKIVLAEESFHNQPDIHEEITEDDDTPAIIEKIFNTSIQTLRDTRNILNDQSVEHAAKAILSADNILVFGTGISGIIARDIWMKLFRLKLNVSFYDNQITMKMAAALATDKDVILAVSHSGSTTAVVSALREVKKSGATTVGLTNYLNTPMTRFVDILLLTSSRETGVREEEMTSRIAQLAVVDALFVTVSNQSYARFSGYLKMTRAAVSEDKI